MSDTQIHVARPPTQLGVFSQEEIAQGLGNGRFLPTDQGWREGMDAWLPLSQWQEFAGVGAGAGVPANPVETFGAPVNAEPMPAWERGSNAGNFFATFRDVATNPVETFDRLPESGNVRSPIAFSYLSMLPAMILLAVIYAAIFSFMGSDLMAGLPGRSPLAGLGKGALLAVLCGGLFCIYLVMPLMQFIGSAFVHVLLLPWSPKGGYVQSFRATSYVHGVFFPLSCIPCVNYIATPWQIVVNVIALSRVHKIAWWKVMISVVVVPCLCCCAVYAAVLIPLISKANLR
jgi:hypothetical protein